MTEQEERHGWSDWAGVTIALSRTLAARRDARTLPLVANDDSATATATEGGLCLEALFIAVALIASYARVVAHLLGHG